MIRSFPVVLTVFLLLGSRAAAQTVSDGAPTASADSTLDSEIALGDSTRALLAQDDSRTQVDQVRLDSLQALLARDRKLTPRRAATVTQDQAAVNQTKRLVHRDLAGDKHTRARLASIEQQIKKEQAPAKTAARPAAHSR
jgi:hypothetical protein